VRPRACRFKPRRNRAERTVPSVTEEEMFSGFPSETARFLRAFGENNDKAWFDAHRADYESAYLAPARSFVAALGPRLQRISPAVAFAPKVNGSIFRINRDVRFFKDKWPYKDHIDLWFWRGDRRGWDSPGFFFRMYSKIQQTSLQAHLQCRELPTCAAIEKDELAIIEAMEDRIRSLVFQRPYPNMRKSCFLGRERNEHP
ncbi:MAG TPA: DUF2461 family protein, partial [Opitutaceae bacterium]